VSETHKRLTLIPGVITKRDHIHAHIKKFIANRSRDAESARCVLAIGDHEIDVEAFAQQRQMLHQRLPPCSSNHIAKK
jgi:hypothetical protein